MLGANAVDLWGFDADLLQAVADRVGPTVADLATPLALADIEDTFSWSLARPVPLAARAHVVLDESPRQVRRGTDAGTKNSLFPIATGFG